MATKSKKKLTLKSRIGIDSFLLLFFLLEFGMFFTGGAIHNIIGIISFLLILLHLYAGRTWFFSLGKKIPGAKQWVPLLLNFSLAFAVFFLFTSGFVLLFIRNAGMIVRQVHTVSSYGALLLLGAHVGLYWERVHVVMYPLRKIFHTLFFFCIHALALYGVYACFEIDLFGKLFQGVSFEFWDDSKPTVLFFLPRIALFCLSGVLVRYCLFFFGKRKVP